MRPFHNHSSTFSVLLVCTGNVCRSPVGERLLAAALPASVTVGSAGTRALVGEPIAAPMVPLLTAAGGSARDFAARRLTQEMAQEAHLVLAFTRAQRGAVVEECPASVRRCFTLLEFLRTLGAVDPSALPTGSVENRLEAAVPLAASRRSPATTDDILDPFGQSLATYEAVFIEIQRAVRSISEILLRQRAA